MPSDPWIQFEQIYQRALALDMKYPNAMVLSTVDERGQPTSRWVLLKHYDAAGFVFYTNTASDKGRHLEGNRRAALAFYWQALGAQIRVQGKAGLVSDDEADEYFATRARRNQLGAWASRQSAHLANRPTLLASVARFAARFAGGEVPRPPWWCGYRVVPNRFEFWTERPFRLHDRIIYERTEGAWHKERLYP